MWVLPSQCASAVQQQGEHSPEHQSARRPPNSLGTNHFKHPKALLGLLRPGSRSQAVSVAHLSVIPLHRDLRFLSPSILLHQEKQIKNAPPLAATVYCLC